VQEIFFSNSPVFLLLFFPLSSFPLVFSSVIFRSAPLPAMLLLQPPPPLILCIESLLPTAVRARPLTWFSRCVPVPRLVDLFLFGRVRPFGFFFCFVSFFFFFLGSAPSLPYPLPPENYTYLFSSDFREPILCEGSFRLMFSLHFLPSNLSSLHLHTLFPLHNSPLRHTELPRPPVLSPCARTPSLRLFGFFLMPPRRGRCSY